MTSQKDQIQALITEIDGVLSKASPRLPWVMTGDAAQQRRVLEHVRSYLVAQQRTAENHNVDHARARRELLAHDIHYQQSPPPYSATSEPRDLVVSGVSGGQDLGALHQDAARQILQAVMQEMASLRSHLIQPLQADVEALRQQRESLMQEVRQLEIQRQPDQQQIITDFLQALMERLQESLTRQVTQTIANLESEPLRAYDLDLGGVETAALVGDISNQPLLSAAQRLEQLQMLQSRSDQLLMTLDSTLSVIFESLQRNVQSYQDSLASGLEKMHGLGQQGEVMFTALVNHLAQRLGREASSYLQSSLYPGGIGFPAQATPGQSTSTPNREAENEAGAPSDLGAEAANSPVSPPSDLEAGSTTSNFGLPYPGVELSTTYPSGAELGAGDFFSLGLTQVPDLRPEDINLAELDLSDLNLENLVTGTTGTESEAAPTDAVADWPETDLAFATEDEITRLQTDDDEIPASDEADLEAEADVPVVDPSLDLDSALEFLEQLSAELEEPSDDVETISEASPDVEIAVTPEEPEAAIADLEQPDDQSPRDYSELDEFYESLFGPNGIAVEAELPDIAAELEPETPSMPPVEEAITASPLDTGTTAFIQEGLFEGFADPTLEGDNLEQFLGDRPSSEPQNLSPEIPAPATISDGPAGPSLEDLLFNDNPEDLFSGLGIVESGPRTLGASGLNEAPRTEAPEPETPELEIPEIPEAIAQPPQSQQVKVTFQSLTLESFNFEAAPSDVARESTTGTPAPQSEATSLPNFIETPEDSYIPAAPEEDLLASEEAPAESSADLWLDPNTLQQLDEDLFSLENLSLSEAFDLGQPDDLTDDPFYTQPAAPAETPDPLTLGLEQIPAEAPPSSENPEFTLEALDDWFGDLPPASSEPDDSFLRDSEKKN